MCNLFNLKTKLEEVAGTAKALTPAQLQLDFEKVVAPKKAALAILANSKGERELTNCRFGLIPLNAKSADQYKQPLNNARVDKLNAWPWKMSVKRSRCLVPLTSYYEYSYWGEHAGHKLEFSCGESPILFAAGIFSSVFDQISMTMITRPAIQEIMDCGHHRMPFFVDVASSDAWPTGDYEFSECFEQLQSLAVVPDFEIEQLEKMKSGWEKRAEQNLVKREAEEAAIAKFGEYGCQY